MNPLHKRILEISVKLKLSHLGSCLTAVDIIDEIYREKKSDDIFVLSSGHAALAWYVVLEKYGGKNAEEIFHHHGVHPDRCEQCGLTVSAGSLGHGLGIAVGMAIQNPQITAHVLSSDGETNEGSWWEAVRIASELSLQNIRIHVNCNGWGAYKAMEADTIQKKIAAFIENPIHVTIHKTNSDIYGLEGMDAHYRVLEEMPDE